MKWIFVDRIIEFMKLIDEMHSIFDLEHENLDSKFFSIFVKNSWGLSSDFNFGIFYSTKNYGEGFSWIFETSR